MSRPRQPMNSQTLDRWVSGALLSLLLLSMPLRAIAHAGHGDQEFQGGSQVTQSTSAIQVDADTAERMGLKVAAVSRKRLAFGVQATGQIEALPSKKVEVTNPVGGTVVQLYVQPGDAVKAGQPVALISSPALADLRVGAMEKRAEAKGNVQQAQADLQLAQDNYGKQQKLAEADIQQAKIALDFAQERYSKDRELQERGAIPRRTMLESETKLAEAKAVFAKAQSRLPVAEAAAQLKRSRSQLQVAQSRVDLSSAAYEARLKQLGATPNPDGTVTVTAAIAGTVADRDVTLGQSAQDAGAKLMTIVDGQTVLAVANIYEKDLNQVSLGKRIRVTVNSLPNRIFPGRITVVGSVVEGDARVVPVKAELENAGGLLKPGMFAQLEVLTEQTLAAVIAIPHTAIVETNGKQLVYVQNGQNFEPAEVVLGRAAGNLVEITSGLFDGDQVVVQGAPMLYAQSLRSQGKLLMEGDEHEASQTPTTSSASILPALPWWLVLPGMGAIAVGMFFAGSHWSNRRHRTLSSGGPPDLDNRPSELTAFSSDAKPGAIEQPAPSRDSL